MPLSGEAKREYQKFYMRRYRRWVRGGGVGNVLKRDQEMWRQRHLLKLALNRLERARAHEAKFPGSVDVRRLNLAWQWNQLVKSTTSN